MLQVTINDIEFEFFSRISLNLTYDKVASIFELTMVHDPNNKSLEDIYKPLSFNVVKIYESLEIVFTGIMLNHSFTAKNDQKTLIITGYSTCGVLQDCSIPKAAYPLQDNGKTLIQICQKICNAFDVELFVNQISYPESNQAYAKAVAEPTNKAANYIARIASQKNIIVGNTRLGELLLTKLRITEPYVGRYNEDSPGVVITDYNVNAQRMHSEVRILSQANVLDNDRAEFSATNEKIKTIRPLVEILRDGDINNGKNLAQNILDAEMKNISIGMQLTTHRYQNGKVIKPNRRLTLVAPSIFINEPTEFFVEDVILAQTTGEGEIAQLKLIPVQAAS